MNYIDVKIVQGNENIATIPMTLDEAFILHNTLYHQVTKQFLEDYFLRTCLWGLGHHTMVEIYATLEQIRLKKQIDVEIEKVLE